MTEPRSEQQVDAANRRQYYRVEYPVVDRPAFRAGAIRGVVCDCSEAGVRAELEPIPADVTIKAGDRMGATVQFQRGEMADVAGEVVRFDGKTLVLRLDRERIPFGKILREQWWLRQKYPWREKK